MLSADGAKAPQEQTMYNLSREEFEDICEVLAEYDELGFHSILTKPSVMDDQDTFNVTLLADEGDPDVPYQPAELTCMYSRGLRRRSPFLEIGPMKIEVLSYEPEVYMIHEIVLQEEIWEIGTLSVSSVRTPRIGLYICCLSKKNVYF